MVPADLPLVTAADLRSICELGAARQTLSWRLRRTAAPMRCGCGCRPASSSRSATEVSAAIGRPLPRAAAGWRSTNQRPSGWIWIARRTWRASAGITERILVIGHSISASWSTVNGFCSQPATPLGGQLFLATGQRVARDEEQRQPRAQCARRLGELHAAHAGQRQVAQDEIDCARPFLKQLQRSSTIRRIKHSISQDSPEMSAKRPAPSGCLPPIRIVAAGVSRSWQHGKCGAWQASKN